METSDKIRAVVTVHFDPKWGSPYWLRQAREFQFDPLVDVQSLDDLTLFGPMDLSALAHEPVEAFIPRKFHQDRHRFITSETGGTTGPPKRTAFSEEDFTAAFIAPFLASAKLMGFPKSVNWLFIGPSGPHIIGKAARRCATAMGSIDPFTIDFDPRWVRKLPGNSFARQRYVRHVLEQAVDVLKTQDIGVIFATPPILSSLGKELDPGIRDNIQGIHLGGMAASNEFWEQLTGEWYLNAKVMGGYGNSLFGMCPQLQYVPGEPPEYFVHGVRLVLDIDSIKDGDRGAVTFHRLDESGFLPNCLERDEGEIVELPVEFSGTGFQSMGIRDPRPPKSQEQAAQAGLY